MKEKNEIKRASEWGFWPQVPEGGAPVASFGTDPQGSYTGVPEVPNERPVQDADDL